MFFTVAVPTYNRSRLLRRCLDSIKKQTFSDYEVLILDDCSSDDTPEVVKEYTEDKRFKYVRFEENCGSGSQVYKIAQDNDLYNGEWVVLLADDEYLYNAFHLERIQENVIINPDSNFVAVDCGYGYSDIDIFLENVVPLPSKSFLYDDLTLEQKRMFESKIKVIYKKDFLIGNDVFNIEKQNKTDICFEVPYYNLFRKANLLYISGIVHIFGITPDARRKYLDFYNWIVSTGMVAYEAKDRELACQRLLQNYTESSMCLNAFFDWGGAELAKALSYFVLDKNFPEYLRNFAKIYKEKFQDKLYEYYNPFNAMLMSENEREEAISSAKNIVIYGENSWRGQIQEHLIKKGKKISYVADDNKSGYKNYQDILREKDSIDLVFISSGSPRVIYQMFSKLRPRENKIKVATLILRDEWWNRDGAR